MCQLPESWASCTHVRQAAYAVLHFVVDGTSSTEESRGVFVSDLLNPEKKPGFCKAAVELMQGMSERKLLSSIKSLWDRQHPVKLSHCVMVLAGLVQAKRRLGVSAAETLPGTLPAG